MSKSSGAVVIGLLGIIIGGAGLGLAGYTFFITIPQINSDITNLEDDLISIKNY